MGPQLSALFAQHKVAILGAGAAGAILLGLRTRKKGGTATTAGALVPQPAGTLPAAAVAPGIGATYDSTGNDVYALQDEIATFLQQQAAQTSTSSQGAASGVAPIASQLFGPTGTGNFVQYANGTVAEVESDGSQLGLSWGQWQPLAAGGAKPQVSMPGSASGQFYTAAGNLAAKKPPAAA